MANTVGRGVIATGDDVWACVNGNWVRSTVQRLENDAILVAMFGGGAPVVLPPSHVKSIGVARAEWKQTILGRAQAGATHTLTDLATLMNYDATWNDARDVLLSLVSSGHVTATPSVPSTSDAPVALAAS